MLSKGYKYIFLLLSLFNFKSNVIFGFYSTFMRLILYTTTIPFSLKADLEENNIDMYR